MINYRGISPVVVIGALGIRASQRIARTSRFCPVIDAAWQRMSVDSARLWESIEPVLGKKIWQQL
jgi:hypothetical protein